METFTKRTTGRPAHWEVAGLSWLAEQKSAGGADVVEVVGLDSGGLTESRVVETGASPDTASDFGRRLAVTHDVHDVNWGEGPRGWEGSGYRGPNQRLLDLPLTPQESWGVMYAENQLMSLVPDAGYDATGVAVFERLAQRLRDGEFETGDSPARLHGDLWSGNLMWTSDGCVLIDPSAHVGHRETDLAALALFGCPYLDRIINGYNEVHPLAGGWGERVRLHQLSMVLMHAVVFGGGYRREALEIARAYG